MISQMRRQDSESVLEVGCGRGEISYWIASSTGKEVLGTDLCEPFIEYARATNRLPNLRYEVLDLNAPGLDEMEPFDYIVGNGILHHLYHQLDEVLPRMRSLLRNNGKMVFIEPNIYNPYCAMIFKVGMLRRMADLEPDEMAFSGSFIRKRLEKAGFQDISTSYRDFLLPGVPMGLVKPLIAIGDILEKLPLLNRLSQSVFITASK